MTAKIFWVYTKTIWYWLAIVGSQESRGNMAGFVGVEVLRREAGVRRRHGGFARVKVVRRESGVRRRHGAAVLYRVCIDAL